MQRIPWNRNKVTDMTSIEISVANNRKLSSNYTTSNKSHVNIIQFLCSNQITSCSSIEFNISVTLSKELSNKDRNDQEKNNKHNQTQGGTNTIKTINVSDRCFDWFDWNIRSIQTILLDWFDFIEMIENDCNLIPIKGTFHDFFFDNFEMKITLYWNLRA